MAGSEASAILWIAAILGAVSVAMRLIRAYGDEMLDFAKWARTFVEEIRKLRG
jgi:hypothetical protein